MLLRYKDFERVLIFDRPSEDPFEEAKGTINDHKARFLNVLELVLQIVASSSEFYQGKIAVIKPLYLPAYQEIKV